MSDGQPRTPTFKVIVFLLAVIALPSSVIGGSQALQNAVTLDWWSALLLYATMLAAIVVGLVVLTRLFERWTRS